MTKFTVFKTSLLAAAIGVASVPMIAQAALGGGEHVGVSEADIRAALEAHGYVVGAFEYEDDEIEVTATLDGQEYEIEISPETGKVIEVELED